MEELQMYLENVEEFVNDQNLIVTYKWLSRTLSIHVNKSKQILFKFVNDCKDLEKKKINVTYFISGIQLVGSDLIQKFCVVPDYSLEKTKGLFDTINSLHVYSVQKIRSLDGNSLHIADVNKQKEMIMQSNHFSAISCPHAEILTPESLSQEKIQVSSSVEQKTLLKNSDTLKSKNDSISKKNMDKGKKETSKSTVVGKKFANGIKKEFKADTRDKKEVDKNVKNSSKGLKGMFAAQIGKSSKIDPIKTKNESSLSMPAKEPNTKNIPNSPDMFNSPVDGKSNKNSKEDAKRSKPSYDSSAEKSLSLKKNRKRILQPDTSSSEDEDDTDHEVNSSVELDYGNEDSKDTSAHKDKPGCVKIINSTRNKRQKLVDKTWVDEDGFLVTEKVLESASESESEVNDITEAKKNKELKEEIKKTIIAPAPISKKATQKPKQASLMNFFKKKDN